VQNLNATRHYFYLCSLLCSTLFSDSTSCITAQLRYNKSEPKKGNVFYATSTLRIHPSIHANRILHFSQLLKASTRGASQCSQLHALVLSRCLPSRIATTRVCLCPDQNVDLRPRNIRSISRCLGGQM